MSRTPFLASYSWPEFLENSPLKQESDGKLKRVRSASKKPGKILKPENRQNPAAAIYPHTQQKHEDGSLPAIV